MMQTVIKFSAFILLAKIHPFHVSVCEIYHNAETKSLEISMKIFIDDLELAIRESGIVSFELLEVAEKNVDKIPLEYYLKNQFEISVNDKALELDFVGFEFDQDAILCYFEGKRVRKISSIKIKNAIITEVFDDQINLTHVQYNGEMKSLKAIKEQPIGIIDTSSW